LPDALTVLGNAVVVARLASSAMPARSDTETFVYRAGAADAFTWVFVLSAMIFLRFKNIGSAKTPCQQKGSGRQICTHSTMLQVALLLVQ
jgi:hypothetical protein